MSQMREVRRWNTKLPPPDRGGISTRFKSLLREQPISRLPDWDKIEKMIDRDTYGGLGGEIADIIRRRPLFIVVENITVAALRLVLYVSYYDDSSAEKQISDSVEVTLYRNPKAPQHLKACF